MLCDNLFISNYSMFSLHKLKAIHRIWKIWASKWMHNINLAMSNQYLFVKQNKRCLKKCDLNSVFTWKWQLWQVHWENIDVLCTNTYAPYLDNPYKYVQTIAIQRQDIVFHWQPVNNFIAFQRIYPFFLTAHVFYTHISSVVTFPKKRIISRRI